MVIEVAHHTHKPRRNVRFETEVAVNADQGCSIAGSSSDLTHDKIADYSDDDELEAQALNVTRSGDLWAGALPAQVCLASCCLLSLLPMLTFNSFVICSKDCMVCVFDSGLQRDRWLNVSSRP